MKKILTVIGTRPEIIRLSALLSILDQKFQNIIIFTGQHYDNIMGYKFFEELNLPKPHHDLKIGKTLSHKQVSIMTEKIGDILIKEKPNLVLVYGDTNSVLAGALAASKTGIKIAHLEAGCRSFNKTTSEEINRIIVDHISHFLFPPDRVALKNLENEGLKSNVFYLGSTGTDSCLRNLELSKRSKILDKLKLKHKEYVLVTIHRAENTNDKNILSNIIDGLNKISNTIEVIFPIHPRTSNIINKNNIPLSKKIKILEPLPYLDFLNLMNNSFLVLTDSGGIQEEAAICNVPCLVLRNETEWTRLVNLGKNFLIGVEPDKIERSFLDLFNNKNKYNKILKIKNQIEKDVHYKILETLEKNI